MGLNVRLYLGTEVGALPGYSENIIWSEQQNETKHDAAVCVWDYVRHSHGDDYHIGACRLHRWQAGRGKRVFSLFLFPFLYLKSQCNCEWCIL